MIDASACPRWGCSLRPLKGRSCRDAVRRVGEDNKNDLGCLSGSAAWGWRASYLRGWTHRIAAGRRRCGSSRRTRRGMRCGVSVRRSGTNLSAPKPSLGNRGANARQRVSDMWSPVGRSCACICYHSPPPGLAHLPTQFAARSSHRTPFASAAELKSTPVPMRLIAKKRCRVMVEPPEKEPVICSSLPAAFTKGTTGR